VLFIVIQSPVTQMPIVQNLSKLFTTVYKLFAEKPIIRCLSIVTMCPILSHRRSLFLFSSSGQ